MPESYTTSGSYKVPVPGENRMIAQLSKTSFFFPALLLPLLCRTLARKEKFSGTPSSVGVLRGGCPNGVMLDGHDLQLVKFLYGDTVLPCTG